MFDIENGYELRHDELRKKIRTIKHFDAAIAEALALHALVHSVDDSGLESEVRCGLSDAHARMFVKENTSVIKLALKRAFIKRSYTIAWHIWHITRIEDLVGNLLIANVSQIYNDDWHNKLNNSIIDTGNVMTDAAVAEFSKAIDMTALWAYRDAVSTRTREIIGQLKQADLNRKPAADSLARLFAEGGLTKDHDSAWLADFWGKKTFAGLILLPLTRHHLMHLNVCRELRNEFE